MFGTKLIANFVLLWWSQRGHKRRNSHRKVAVYFVSKRGPQCQICRHAERWRLELLRAGGASLDSLAEKFGVSRDPLHRHWTRHVSDEMRASYLCGRLHPRPVLSPAGGELHRDRPQHLVTDSVILYPVQTASNLIAYETGYFRGADVRRMGIAMLGFTILSDCVSSFPTGRCLGCRCSRHSHSVMALQQN